jgi:hypothetical protein
VQRSNGGCWALGVMAFFKKKYQGFALTVFHESILTIR